MNPIFSTAVLCTTLVGIGCATDPARQVRDADAKHTADVRETEKERVDVAAQQEKDSVALDATHAKQDIKLDKAAADDWAADDKRQGDAHTKVHAARNSFQTGAVARLVQVEARVKVLEGNKARQKMLAPGLSSVRRSYDSAKEAVIELNEVSDRKWFAAKKVVDQDIHDLEDDVDDIEARL